MLVQSIGTMEAGVMKCTMVHNKAEMGCLAEKQFEKGMVVAYYNGTLMYTKLSGDKGWEEVQGRNDVSEIEIISVVRDAHLWWSERQRLEEKAHVDSTFPLPSDLQ